MRSFLIGLGIGTIACVATVALLVSSLNSLDNDDEVPLVQLQVDLESHDNEQAENEYSVIVKLKLSDNGMGTHEELESGFALEDLLIATFESDPAMGEFDGDGVGFGYFDIYMYTSNPEYVVEQILPIVRAMKPTVGSHIITHVTETGADEIRYDI